MYRAICPLRMYKDLAREALQSDLYVSLALLKGDDVHGSANATVKENAFSHVSRLP